MTSRLIFAPRPSCLALRLAAMSLILLLAACGSATVDVVLPADSQTVTGSKATCRGVMAGTVSALSNATPKTATVTLESSEVAGIVLRDGVTAYVLDSGDIEFDVTRVTDTSARLPSGSTLMASRRNAVEAVIQRWATGWNVTVIVAGLAAMLLMLMIARSFARGVAGIVRLTLSCGVALAVAYMVTPALSPLVERHVYPLLESARSHPASGPQSSPPSPTKDASTDPADAGAGAAPRDLNRLAESASEQLGSWARQAADTLRNRPLPDPMYPTFFALWLTAFVVSSSMLVAITRSR